MKKILFFLATCCITITTAVPQGNVYFTNNASITLDAENNVYLDSDVEVQTGVKLNIE